MAGECVSEGPDLKEMGEEELWELINDNRHRISLGVRPCTVIPYLRQARVLTELDEDEILSCHNLTNRSMRTSYMLDLLRTQGRNGAVALLESLMIHYPPLYTQVTGRKPSTEPSRFSGLMKYSELTEYLIRAVTGMQKELQQARCEAGQMSARCASLESEIEQMSEQEEKSRCLQSENEHMQRHVCSLQREITKLKDEKCDLYMRYTAAIEEKSAVNLHCHDLNLQVYQLQTELQNAQSQNKSHNQRLVRRASAADLPQLHEDIKTLRCQLMKATYVDPARQDILAQDLAEAIDGQTELAGQLRCYREENEQLLREKEELVNQKETLSLQVQQLTVDVSMYQKKISVIQSQIRELQAERDQAYQSRDEAQAHIARNLTEKDTLRCQLMELQEKVFSLRVTRSEHQGSSEQRHLSWDSQRSSSEESMCPPRRRLCRMDALNPTSLTVYNSECEDPMLSSIRSRNAEPPCAESLRRRYQVLYADDSLETAQTDSSLDDFVFLPFGSEDEKTPRRSSSSGTASEGFCLRTAAPPFLMRSRQKAIRVNGRVITISFNGEALLGQLAVVGGNKTGVFVHQVTEGSAAHVVGINSGAQIVEVKYEQKQQVLRMVLEDSTLEEAMWALGQVKGLCHLSLRPRQHDYEMLLQQLQTQGNSSGDSFYVRVNLSLPAGSKGTLAVSCNDILHVTNTRPASSEGLWYASQVHPCQLLDLQSGNLPNYYRAQRLLILAIEHMNFQTKKGRKAEPVVSQEQQKAVRIVSTGRQGRNPMWVSVEDENTESAEPVDSSTLRSCVTLMPYTLVTPHYPPSCRPILLLPTILGHILDKKLAAWTGFELCEPEVLSSNEHAARLQRSEILEECEQGQNCCYTLQSVEKVVKKGIHCVLPLGLDCVRRLQRAEIFPIIIFIAQSARTARKLRSKLHRNGHSEEQLLTCSQNEEPLLDKLPCLYHSMSPDSWCDSATLLTSLRTVIWAEQKKIVWVEPDLW
ncbi:caspase recruitment domain-containing protein 14 isoform X3 [Thalassophryne amazonica]|uniref:caspase recruitment domain-containing protein 14 isoform X3 n=1 Tax=Thalassophryne amazonica TaxID=390379 RepID=UPI001470F47C|nr:caspase recruitment domain-containing protein 14 isoform X3 [Thalassophryne amazonica]